MTAPATQVVQQPRQAGTTGLQTLHCVGLSHRTAGVSLRERLAQPASTVAALLSRWGCGTDARPRGVSELVVLSTCNRVELYATGDDATPTALASLLADPAGLTPEAIAPVLYTLSGDDVVRHLCRVSAGLDSMIVGETQILGQISDAYVTSVGHGAAADTLSILFRGAIRAGRRARAETRINRNPGSVSSAAVRLVGNHVTSFEAASVLIVGAGETAELALSALHKRGVRRICVVNRTAERGAELSRRFGGESAAFERLQELLCDVDVVISSTGAPHHVITRQMIQAAMACRPDRHLVIVDIALPRDVEPTAAMLHNVSYVDLDGLQGQVGAAIEERQTEIPLVEAVVDEEVAACCAALAHLDIRPLIAAWRAQTEQIRQSQLERALSGLEHLGPTDRLRIAAFSESLTNRLFHAPMRQLRDEAARGEVSGTATMVRRLFGLG